ncbi:MAG: helix-turn-helix transcriptional regulator [Chitinophagaceae bacterium]|nr:helix-turn-helix transcriptional regulator [Chitinophagaceae bacterium]
MLAINIFTSFLVVSLFLILFFRKGNSLPNKILGLVFLTPGLNFIDNIFILTEGVYIFPWTYFFVQITAALFAPLSYYYVLLMTKTTESKSFRWLKSISALIILYGIYMAISFAMMDSAAQQTYMTSVLEGPYPDDMVAYSAVLFSHQLLYFSFNAIQVFRYRKKMMQQVSDLPSVKADYLIRYVILLWVLTLITVILYITIDTTIVEYIFLPLVLVTIFLFILYYAFNENAVFSVEEFAEHLQKVGPSFVNDASSDEKPELKSEEDEKLFAEIQRVIEENKLYANADVNMESLSSALGLPAYKIVGCIKNNNTTFYELIRRTRVKKAKELLSDENCHFTIEGIAYEVGFNSRASFYRAFRKYEGTDPSSLAKSPE